MITGCEMNGRVVDSETGAPISGALVIAEWSGDIGGPVQSSQVCFHLEIATTDAEGRYHIPAWRRRPVTDHEGGFHGLRNVEVSRRTYKAGYSQLKFDPNDTSTILMVPFKGSPFERVEYLLNAGTAGCGREDGSLTKELSFWEAVCDEARKLPGASTLNPDFRNRSFLQEIDVRMASVLRGTSQAAYVPERVTSTGCSKG